MPGGGSEQPALEYMLDLFAIFTTGGIVLWIYSPIPSFKCQELLSSVMQAIITEATFLANSMILGALELHWVIQRDLGLIFLAAHQKILPLTYIPQLMEHVKNLFVKRYGDSLGLKPFAAISDFEEPFLKLCRLVEESDKGCKTSVVRDQKKSSKVKKSATTESKKQQRDWGDKVNKTALDTLDLSSEKSRPSLLNSSTVKTLEFVEGFGELRDLEVPTAQEPKNGGIWDYFEKLTGQKEVSREDLVGPVNKMKDHLVSKNVASQVAQVIIDSVVEDLIGAKTGAFNTITNMVKGATEAAVSRILIPNGSTDLIGDIQRTRVTRPYVIAFVGVNGVGKSTNLSKVCFWLMQNNFKILLVAGDTFRSGAVEQLRTHVSNLSTGRLGQVELFERGYGKDAASVAKDAISFAKNNNFDVVMIDTAGRMQDNVPLMKALAKLVHVNHPDRLIFVGEALVGHEAVDQLRKFNAALCDYTPAGAPKLIDGILLTKFDTIDDKVGAALSMTYIAKAPILFVGVGQTYTDLRRLNVQSVVSALFK